MINELYDSTRNGFGYLRASGNEADLIANALQENRIETNLIKGADADEESFRKMDGNSPSIIHLSTHGFYLVGFDKYTEYFDKLLSYSIKDNSMLLSGMLLADDNNGRRNSNVRFKEHRTSCFICLRNSNWCEFARGLWGTCEGIQKCRSEKCFGKFMESS